MLGNDLDMAVALGWVHFGQWTEHGRRARRHDNRGLRGVFGHSIINPILVVGAVGNDGGERIVDLVEQGAEFGSIVDLLAGQGRGNDRAGLRINSKIQLAPRTAALGAMLLPARPAR